VNLAQGIEHPRLHRRFAMAPSPHPIGYGQYMSVIVSGMLLAAGQWTLVTKLSEMNTLIPCNDLNACVYYKMFSDGTLPSSLAAAGAKYTGTPDSWKRLAFFIITNGLANSSGFDDYVVGLPQPLCSNETRHGMRALCSSDEVRDRVINPLVDAKSGKVFKGGILGSAILRILHDLCILAGIDQTSTISLNFGATMFSILSGASAVYWAMGAFELFYAPVGEDCGCFFRADIVTCILLFAIAGGVLKAALNGAENLMRAIIGGDFLMTVAYFVPHQLVMTSSANPTGSLLGISGLGAPTQGSTFQGVPFQPLSFIPWVTSRAWFLACIAISPVVTFFAIRLENIVFQVLHLELTPVWILVVYEPVNLIWELWFITTFLLPRRFRLKLCWFVKPAPLHVLEDIACGSKDLLQDPNGKAEAVAICPEIAGFIAEQSVEEYSSAGYVRI